MPRYSPTRAGAEFLLSLVDCEQPLSELARRTETPLSLLHHHVGKLIRLGLVEVTREVPRAGAPMRFYRAVARVVFLSADPRASTPGADVNDRLRALLDRGPLRSLQGVS